MFRALSLVPGRLVRMRLISERRIRTGRESRDIKRLPGLSIHHADLRCARTAPVTLGGCWRRRGKHWEGLLFPFNLRTQASLVGGG